MTRKLTRIRAARTADCFFAWRIFEQYAKINEQFQRAARVHLQRGAAVAVWSLIYRAFPNTRYYVVEGLEGDTIRQVGVVALTETSQPRVYELDLMMDKERRGFGSDLWANILLLGKRVRAHRFDVYVASFQNQTILAIERHTNLVKEGTQRATIWHEDRWHDLQIYGVVLDEEGKVLRGT